MPAAGFNSYSEMIPKPAFHRLRLNGAASIVKLLTLAGSLVTAFVTRTSACAGARLLGWTLIESSAESATTKPHRRREPPPPKPPPAAAPTQPPSKAARPQASTT